MATRTVADYSGMYATVCVRTQIHKRAAVLLVRVQRWHAATTVCTVECTIIIQYNHCEHDQLDAEQDVPACA